MFSLHFSEKDARISLTAMRPSSVAAMTEFVPPRVKTSMVALKKTVPRQCSVAVLMASRRQRMPILQAVQMSLRATIQSTVAATMASLLPWTPT